MNANEQAESNFRMALITELASFQMGVTNTEMTQAEFQSLAEYIDTENLGKLDFRTIRSFFNSPMKAQTATLNILASVLGYKNFAAFRRSQHDEQTNPAPNPSNDPVLPFQIGTVKGDVKMLGEVKENNGNIILGDLYQSSPTPSQDIENKLPSFEEFKAIVANEQTQIQIKEAGTVNILNQSDGLSNAIMEFRLDDIFDEIDAEKSEQIIHLHKKGFGSQMLRFLSRVLPEKYDPTERVWIYHSLGKIGGAEARSLLENGIKDADELARRAAENALKSMN